MTQRVADQHELLNRWREIADEQHEVLGIALGSMEAAGGYHGSLGPAIELARAALRRYEEARDE